MAKLKDIVSFKEFEHKLGQRNYMYIAQDDDGLVFAFIDNPSVLAGVWMGEAPYYLAKCELADDWNTAVLKRDEDD